MKCEQEKYHCFLYNMLTITIKCKEKLRNEIFFFKALHFRAHAYGLRQPTKIDRCIMHILAQKHTLAYRISCWMLTLDSNSKIKFLTFTFQFESIRSNDKRLNRMAKKATILSMKDCLIAALVELTEGSFAGFNFYVHVVPSIVNDFVTKWNL